MSVIQRQAIKGSIVSYTGVLLGFFTTVYFLPHFLSEEQIGLYRVVLDTGILIGGFATLGMPNLILKFFPYLKNEKTQHNGFILYLFLVPFVGFIIYGTLIIVFDKVLINYLSKSTTGYESYFAYILPLVILIAIFMCLESFSNVNNRIVVPKIIREVLVKFMLITLLVSYYLEYISFMNIIQLLSVVYFIALLAIIIYIKILGNKIFPFRQFKLIQKNISLKMLIFGTFILFNTVGTGMVTKLDTYVVSSELGLAATGIYATAMYIATMIEIPSRSLYQIAMPAITTAFKDNHIKSIETIYKKTTQNLIIISGCLLLLLVVNIDSIFLFFPPEKNFSAGKYVVILIALAKFIDTSIGLNFHILGYSKYYYYTLPLFLLLGLSNVFLNYLFIPFWGINGSAVATLLILTINNIIVLLIVYKKYKIHPFLSKNLYPLVLLLITFIISNYLINIDNLFVSLFCKSAFIVAFIAFFTIKFNLSEDISSIYNRHMSFIKNKLQK